MDPRLVLVVCSLLFGLVVPIAVSRHPARFRPTSRVSLPPTEPWPNIAPVMVAIPAIVPDTTAFAPMPASPPAPKRPSLIFDCGAPADPAELEKRLDQLRLQAASMPSSRLGLTALLLLEQARTHLQAAQDATGDDVQASLRQALVALAGAEASIDRPCA